MSDTKNTKVDGVAFHTEIDDKLYKSVAAEPITANHKELYKALALVTRDDGARGRHPGQAGQTEPLPHLHEDLPRTMTQLTLDEAVDLTRTGDLWLFRGHSAADHAIRVLTNAPVNHVGMAVVIDDLPQLTFTRGCLYCFLPGIGGLHRLAALA